MINNIFFENLNSDWASENEAASPSNDVMDNILSCLSCVIIRANFIIIALNINKMNSEAILSFWFETLTPKQWWMKSEAIDNEIRERFKPTHDKATQGELSAWRQTAHGRLAEIIVLDQFSRNIYRDTPKAFASDEMCLALAEEAVALGLDKVLTPTERAFLYMPYMHSESLNVHDKAVQLFSQKGLDANLDFELKHKVIIERFGRYPHRNAILGRESSEEELAFLHEPNSSF